MAVSVSVNLKAKVRGSELTVSGKVTAKLKEKILGKTVTVAQASESFEHEFDFNNANGRTRQRYGPLVLTITHSKKKACIEGKIKVGSASAKIGEVCTKIET